jgi:hypothetical protein
MKKHNLLYVVTFAVVVFLGGLTEPAHAQYLGLRVGPFALEFGQRVQIPFVTQSFNQPYGYSPNGYRSYPVQPYPVQPYPEQIYADPGCGYLDDNGYEVPCYVAPPVTVVYWYDSYNDVYYYHDDASGLYFYFDVRNGDRIFCQRGWLPTGLYRGSDNRYSTGDRGYNRAGRPTMNNINSGASPRSHNDAMSSSGQRYNNPLMKHPNAPFGSNWTTPHFGVGNPSGAFGMKMNQNWGNSRANSITFKGSSFARGAVRGHSHGR